MANDKLSIYLMGKKTKYEFVSNWLTVVIGVNVKRDSLCYDFKVFHPDPCVVVIKSYVEDEELNRF